VPTTPERRPSAPLSPGGGRALHTLTSDNTAAILLSDVKVFQSPAVTPWVTRPISCRARSISSS
jgi:hypothetical protein